MCSYVRNHWRFMSLLKTPKIAKNAIAQSTSGGACINETINHLVVSGLPFGGVGNSGMGKYHGEWGFRDFSNARALLNHGTSFDPALRYPPYTDEKMNKMKKLMTMKLPGVLDGLMHFLLGNWGETILKFIK